MIRFSQINKQFGDILQSTDSDLLEFGFNKNLMINLNAFSLTEETKVIKENITRKNHHYCEYFYIPKLRFRYIF